MTITRVRRDRSALSAANAFNTRGGCCAPLYARNARSTWGFIMFLSPGVEPRVVRARLGGLSVLFGEVVEEPRCRGKEGRHGAWVEARAVGQHPAVVHRLVEEHGPNRLRREPLADD